MKLGGILFFSLWLMVSCQKDVTDYQPGFQSYVKAIQKRVRTIPISDLKEVDALISAHWQKTAILSCYFCRLDDQYFKPLRIFLENHPETINRVLERQLSKDFERKADHLIFQYFVIHHFPDIHERIMEYFNVDLASVPESGKYYGNMDIWIEFYLDGT